MAPTRGCPTYMLYCKRKGAGGDHCVTVRHGKLFLTLPNNTDPNQLWKKYESSEGGCALIHKATDKAVKYDGIGDQLYLVTKPISPQSIILWDQSGDMGSGYKYLRPRNNHNLAMDAWTGGIFDGTKISLYYLNKNVHGAAHMNAHNQLWKLVPSCMDEFTKAMKVISLKDKKYGQYLTAADDKVSITLTIPGSKGWNQKNTEWRLEWLSEPKNLVGQVRLWSIYDKVLTFAKEPLDYTSKAPDNFLTQESWPVASGAAAAEWRLDIRQRKNDPFLIANLLKMALRGTKLTGEGLMLIANRPSTDPKKPKSKFEHQWRNNSNTWLLEVIVPRSEFVEYDDDPTTTLSNTYDDDQYQKKGPSTPQVSSNAIKSISDAYLCDSLKNVFPRWQVGQVYLHIYQNSAGAPANYGYSNGQYCNSGGNVNGSGTQNNGDISVHNDINRSHDNNVKFINYH